ncbi:hypothetical protein PG991_015915 [Apiospora marii]|uniref:Uncharacterized protein n=1 Tax=Apiospora marii TaxID=335849 RepID=A0ABR1R016_9PEZI
MSAPNNNNAAQPATSGELANRHQRKWARLEKAKPYIDGFLANTPALANLTQEQKEQIHKEIRSQLGDNIEEFMDETAPRTIYQNKEAVRAAFKAIFHWNEPKYGVQYTDGMFDDANQVVPARANNNS